MATSSGHPSHSNDGIGRMLQPWPICVGGNAPETTNGKRNFVEMGSDQISVSNTHNYLNPSGWLPYEN